MSSAWWPIWCDLVANIATRARNLAIMLDRLKIGVVVSIEAQAYTSSKG